MAPVRPEDFDYVFHPGRLKTLRESLSLTQADIAALLNMPVNTVSRWERGSNLPDANSLAAIYSIAQERGITPEFFIRKPSPLTARSERRVLAFHWDFQNRGVDSRYIEGEWSYMERYMGMLFPASDESVRIAYTPGFGMTQMNLRKIGFRVSSSFQNADTQIIREGRRIFGLSDPNGYIHLDSSGRSSLTYNQWIRPELTAYTLISNDGDYGDYLEELQQSGVETFVWGTDKCSRRLWSAVGEDHFIPWERPYVTVKCMEAARELNGLPVSKGEFGNVCKRLLDETGYEVFPEDADFSPKRPYASVLRHMELNGLVRVRELGGSNKVSIAVRSGT